jgi:adenylosuccinate synthase
MQTGKLNIVFGGQAGSEAKGKLSGWLADRYPLDLLVMTSSPNAGHTIVTPEGDKKVSYHLPIASVMCDCPIVLTAASLINVRSFGTELESLGIDPSRILVDPRASIIREHHIGLEEDGGLSDIGSTLQGIGACRRSKMERKGQGHHTLAGDIRDVFETMGVRVTDDPSSILVNSLLDQGATVLCESTQGFDLDLEHGIDPVYCTSKMVNPSMIAAEAGVAPHLVGDTFAVLRPYPIRVNNRTGTSGPYEESREITWADVENRCGHPASYSVDLDYPVTHLEELTTTTKLPRRVFEFSWRRFQHMVRVCRPTHLALQFANYLDWSCYGSVPGPDSPLAFPPAVSLFIQRLEACSGIPVSFVGTGPGHNHMIWRPNARELMDRRRDGY